MNQSLIQFKNVFKQFDTNRVLTGVDFSINKGETTAIVGKSGDGKSVILKHIIGLMQCDSGDILFEGNSLTGMKKKEMSELRSKFSYMFQGAALFDSMTVFDNVALPLKEKTKLTKTEIQKRVLHRLDQLELEEFNDIYPSQLSGGMKKRVALARALVTGPEIVLFDEPTTGLDPVRMNAVHSMISDYQAKLGFTAVVVSHEIPDVFYIAQRVVMIGEGRILFEGMPDAIYQSEHPLVQQFIKGQESRQEEHTNLDTHPQAAKRFKEVLNNAELKKKPFLLDLRQ